MADENGAEENGTTQVQPVVARLRTDEYQELLRRASARNMDPNDYLRKALEDEAFFEDEEESGAQVLLKKRSGAVRPVKVARA